MKRRGFFKALLGAPVAAAAATAEPEAVAGYISVPELDEAPQATPEELYRAWFREKVERLVAQSRPSLRDRIEEMTDSVYGYRSSRFGANGHGDDFYLQDVAFFARHRVRNPWVRDERRAP